MARANKEQLIAERKKVKRQVDLFERKYKQFDTIWHDHLERLDKELSPPKKKEKVKVAEKEFNNG